LLVQQVRKAGFKKLICHKNKREGRWLTRSNKIKGGGEVEKTYIAFHSLCRLVDNHQNDYMEKKRGSRSRISCSEDSATHPLPEHPFQFGVPGCHRPLGSQAVPFIDGDSSHGRINPTSNHLCSTQAC